MLDATEDGKSHQLAIPLRGLPQFRIGSGIIWIACEGRAPL